MARLLVIGSSNTDLTVRLAKLPAPGETVLGGSLLTGPGGKGANQAVAAARAGASVAFLAAVGDDPFGRSAVEVYEAEGIDVSHMVRREGQPSGVALIYVGEAGENMIGVAPGANASLGPDDVDRLPDHLFGPEVLLLVAGLEVPLEAIGRAVERASKAGAAVVLNPGPFDHRLSKAQWLRSVNVVTPNRGELRQFSGLPTATLDQVAEAAAAVRKLGPSRVVVTLGADGALICDEQGVRPIAPVAVEALDAVGAGDAFTAVLAVSIAEGTPLRAAAARAAAAGALAATRPGAQASLPSRAEIDRMCLREKPESDRR